MLASDKVLSGRYSTLYTLMISKKGGLPARIVLQAPKSLQPLAYMGMHLALCSVATLTSVRCRSAEAWQQQSGASTKCSPAWPSAVSIWSCSSAVTRPRLMHGLFKRCCSR